MKKIKKSGLKRDCQNIFTFGNTLKKELAHKF